jgi:F0F1-type ATP synthase membrane subunit b/b'
MEPRHSLRKTMANLLATFCLTPTDATMIPIATVLFFLLWGFLSKNLFQPLLSLAEEREKSTVGADTEAKEVKARTEEIKNATMIKLFMAEKDAQRERLAQLDSSKAEASKILQEAEQLAGNYISQKRVELAGELEARRRGDVTQVEALANLAVNQILSPSGVSFT